MRGIRLSIIVMLACLASACARQQPRYAMVDAATGQPVAQTQIPAPAPVAASPAAPRAGRGLFAGPARFSGANWFSGSTRSAGRGLLSTSTEAPYAASPAAVLQAPGPAPAPMASARAPTGMAAPTYASADYPPSRRSASGSYAAYAPAPVAYQPSYTLDAGGNVTLPLIGSVSARGFTTTQLAQSIAARLRQGYVRDPKVTVEVEVYRPFFILGEVTTPGQYPYSPNMTAETAVAIAGGFGPRASKSTVKVTRNAPGQQFSGDVPLNFPLRPGDTVVVKERWF
jgi:polysaccharide export outer membrane protein